MAMTHLTDAILNHATIESCLADKIVDIVHVVLSFPYCCLQRFMTAPFSAETRTVTCSKTEIAHLAMFKCSAKSIIILCLFDVMFLPKFSLHAR